MENQRAYYRFQWPQCLKPAHFIPDAALKCQTNDGNFELIPFFMNKSGPDFTIIPNNVDRDRWQFKSRCLFFWLLHLFPYLESRFIWSLLKIISWNPKYLCYKILVWLQDFLCFKVYQLCVCTVWSILWYEIFRLVFRLKITEAIILEKQWCSFP